MTSGQTDVAFMRTVYFVFGRPFGRILISLQSTRHDTPDLGTRGFDNSPRCPAAVIQMFLTPDALFILVVDMFAYVEEHSREDALDLWLDILQSRVPGSVVLLVGTHIDSFGGDSAKCNERLRRFEEGRSSWGELVVMHIENHSAVRYICPKYTHLKNSTTYGCVPSPARL